MLNVGEEWRRSCLRWVASALPPISALLLLVPWEGTQSDYTSRLWWRLDPDYSALQVLHHAFATDSVPGPLLYTFGPWGFLAEGYHPETFPAVILGWAMMALGLSLGATATLRNAFPEHPSFVTLGTIAVIVSAAAAPREVVPNLIPAVLLLAAFRLRGRSRTLALIVIVPAASLAASIKLSVAVITAGVVGLIGIDEVVVRRRIPTVPVAVATAMLMLWFVAGRSVADLVGFVRAAPDLVAGYSGGSALELDGAGRAVAFAAASILILALAIVVFRHIPGRTWPLPAAGTALLLFGWFKSGFVRYDPAHVLLALALISGLAFMMLALFLADARVSSWLRWVVVMGFVAAILPLVMEGRTRGSLMESARGLVHPAAAREAADLAFELDMARLRTGEALPALSGTVDVYPYRQAYVLAAGLDYRPRPVFQSYITWTEGLLRLNAAHLRSTRAAQWLLFETGTVDGRYPSLDDGLSWPEILSRYTLAGRTRSFLLLRRTSGGPARFRPLGRALATMGSSVLVPQHSRVWARIHVGTTFLGRAAAIVFKLPSVWLNVRLSGGEVRRYRLVPAMAAAGFLLSPVVDETGEFAMLVEGRLPPDRVESFSVDAGRHAALFFEPQLGIEFEGLE